MTSIGSNQVERKTTTYKISTPFGHSLWLAVDAEGQRWTPLSKLAEELGMHYSTIMSKMGRGAHFWGYRNLESQKTFLPVERITSLLGAIKHKDVPLANRGKLAYLQAEAYRLLKGFKIPEPMVPMLHVELEPEPVRTLVPVQPKPVEPVAPTGLQTFNFGATPIRVVMREGEPWWVAGDVCAVLDISNSRDAMDRLDLDEKNTVVLTDGTPGNPNRTVVSESGLYSLVLGSRKPEAKAFKRWITHEVIPSIRKTGSYGVAQFNVPQTYREALLLAADQQATIEAHQATIATLEPKAQFADRVAAAPDLLTFSEMAKVLDDGKGSCGQNRLTAWLRSKGYLMGKGTEPYQVYVNQGLFVVKEIAFEDRHGLDRVGTKTYVTGKGQLRFQREWDGEAA